jgi:hypothetical protein
MICAECADTGGIRRAHQAGRRRDPDFRVNAIDGRLVDRDDLWHPPGQTYRVGPKGRFTTQTREGLVEVRGVAVVLMHPGFAAHERWFAYATPATPGNHDRNWCFVHEATGFSAGRALCLRGCIHTGLSKILWIDPDEFEKSLSRARRLKAKAR